MEPEGSLPYPQVPAICTYPEPARSSPYPHIPLPNIHINIITPSTLMSPKWSLSLKFPPPKPCISLSSPHTRYMSVHLILLDFITRTIYGEQYRSLSSSLSSFLHSPVTSPLLGPNILLNTLFSNTLSPRSSLSVRDQVSRPYKTTGKITVLCILIFIFLDSKLEDKRFCTEW